MRGHASSDRPTPLSLSTTPCPGNRERYRHFASFAAVEGLLLGVAVPIAVIVATKNPVGLIVGGALKVGGEVTGRSKIEGTAKRTAKKIADELRVAFEKQGWI